MGIILYPVALWRRHLVDACGGLARKYPAYSS
jgi:hypothetical protein